MKHNDIQINKLVANIIVKLCFETNELKKLYDNETEIAQICLSDSYKEIKSNTDKLIGSENIDRMAANIQESKTSLKNALSLYNSVSSDFDNKNKVIAVIDSIYSHLTDLENQINKGIK